MGAFKNDATRVSEEGGGYSKLVTKSDIGRRGGCYMQIVTPTPKKYAQVFIFCLILVSATAAELWLPFQWECHFKHWPES